jgi:hypothetical protein
MAGGSYQVKVSSGRGRSRAAPGTALVTADALSLKSVPRAPGVRPGAAELEVFVVVISSP